MIDADVVAAADVVVNAGRLPHGRQPALEPVGSRAAGEPRRARPVSSPRPSPSTGGGATFLAGNAIGYYGDHGTDPVTEASDSRGDSLLTRVTREWQAVTAPAASAGARVCVLRTAPVMDRAAPPLKQLRVLFRLGLGARLGDGQQYFPMVSLRDWLGAVTHLAADEAAEGPFNICCPETPTNAEFTRALAPAGEPPRLPGGTETACSRWPAARRPRSC